MSNFAVEEITDRSLNVVDFRSVCRQMKTKFDWRIFVRVAELGHRNSLGRNIQNSRIELLALENLSKPSILQRSGDPRKDRYHVRTHAKAAWDHVVDVVPAKPEDGNFVRFLDRLRTNHNLPPLSRSAAEFQILSQDLRLGTHDAAHGRLNFTDCVVAACAVTINHNKLQLL